MKKLWVDLETTGLNPHESRIVEIAVGIELDDDFLVDSWVIHAPWWTDPYVVEMHKKSGLYQESNACWDTTEHAETEVLKLLDEDKYMLAGQSVQFDLSFIKVRMPKLFAKLSHRIFDVRTLITFAEEVSGLEFHFTNEHRAVPDLLETYDTYRHIRSLYEERRPETDPPDGIETDS